jgi:hypothetical protein
MGVILWGMAFLEVGFTAEGMGAGGVTVLARKILSAPMTANETTIT